MTSPARQRASAARLLRRVVVEGRTTDQAMAGRTVSPLTQELVLGSLRHFFSLEQTVAAALDKPLRSKDQDIWLLMIVGVYQLRHMRIPDHAAIFETVTACRELGKPWARGLVNAVLRRTAAAGAADAPDSGGPAGVATERSFEHPDWLEAALRRDYPDAEAVMLANNERAPMALRVNLARSTPAAYRQRLEAAGLRARRPDSLRARRPTGEAAGTATAAMTAGDETLLLEAPVAAQSLPGFADGDVSVQDAGAQLAAPLLLAAGLRSGATLLDACAAPGGKLFHLRERRPDLSLTALENQPERLTLMRQEAERLGHRGLRLLDGDATGTGWWDGNPFQAILLDAPCTGTGTLRRHPDIKLLRRPGDVEQMARLQRRLLANLWRVLEPGGTLLYCTCSILTAENDAVVGDFLATHSDAAAAALALPTGRATRHGWQLLPTDPDTDGFYFARLRRAQPNKARA